MNRLLQLSRFATPLVIVLLLSCKPSGHVSRDKRATVAIQNGDFENEESRMWRAPFGEEVEYSRTDGTNGSRCLLLRLAVDEKIRFGDVYQLVAIPSSTKSLSLRARVRTRGAANARMGIEIFGDETETAPNGVLANVESRPTTSDGTWRQIELKAEVPKGARELRVWLVVKPSDRDAPDLKSAAWFDDIELTSINCDG